MSRKLNGIPYISDYEWIRNQMNADLEYRLESRTKRTSFGRPLYERINVQMITTQECPYHCPFCLERKNPMTGDHDKESQIKALQAVLAEHPNARLTITGGEPSLYPAHIANIVETYKALSNEVFVGINTTGYDPSVAAIAHINLSVNEYVHPELRLFPGSTYQTVLSDDDMRINQLINIIAKTKEESEGKINQYSFRFLSGLEKHEYSVDIWNELMSHPEVEVCTFRIGDFFAYATFNYKDSHGRITLGDMHQKQSNNYLDGYSNIIIHPDGTIGTNWR